MCVCVLVWRELPAKWAVPSYNQSLHQTEVSIIATAAQRPTPHSPSLPQPPTVWIKLWWKFAPAVVYLRREKLARRIYFDFSLFRRTNFDVRWKRFGGKFDEKIANTRLPPAARKKHEETDTEVPLQRQWNKNDLFEEVDANALPFIKGRRVLKVKHRANK